MGEILSRKRKKREIESDPKMLIQDTDGCTSKECAGGDAETDENDDEADHLVEFCVWYLRRRRRRVCGADPATFAESKCRIGVFD